MNNLVLPSSCPRAPAEASAGGKVNYSFYLFSPTLFLLKVKLVSPFRWNSPGKLTLRVSKSNSYLMKKRYFQKQHFKMKHVFKKKGTFKSIKFNAYSIQSMLEVYPFSYSWFQLDWQIAVLVIILSTETVFLVLPAPLVLPFLRSAVSSQEKCSSGIIWVVCLSNWII